MLFFIRFESRRVAIAGITVHPNEAWMKQMARNVTMDEHGVLLDCHYLQHDRDMKITRSFRTIFASGQMLFPRAPRQREGPVRCRERLGGLLRYYHRQVA